MGVMVQEQDLSGGCMFTKEQSLKTYGKFHSYDAGAIHDAFALSTHVARLAFEARDRLLRL